MTLQQQIAERIWQAYEKNINKGEYFDADVLAEEITKQFASHTHTTNSLLIDEVITNIVKDHNAGDTTVAHELLSRLPEETLVNSLPEDLQPVTIHKL